MRIGTGAVPGGPVAELALVLTGVPPLGGGWEDESAERVEWPVDFDALPERPARIATAATATAEAIRALARRRRRRTARRRASRRVCRASKSI
jgi:hypothetical protein